jgi:hypothetical protein
MTCSELAKLERFARIVSNYLLSPNWLHMLDYLELVMLYIRGDDGVVGKCFLLNCVDMLMRGDSSVVIFWFSLGIKISRCKHRKLKGLVSFAFQDE